MAARDTKIVKRKIEPPAPPPRAPKKPRGPRVHLTHFEIKRGERLRLRVAVADDALADVGDALGALIKRIAPGAQTSVVAEAVVAEVEAVEAPPPHVEEIAISPQAQSDDPAYHEKLREYLTGLFCSLCDKGLAAALDIVREEWARRAEGAN